LPASFLLLDSRELLPIAKNHRHTGKQKQEHQPYFLNQSLLDKWDELDIVDRLFHVCIQPRPQLSLYRIPEKESPNPRLDNPNPNAGVFGTTAAHAILFALP
jgi:hypothetical protein